MRTRHAREIRKGILSSKDLIRIRRTYGEPYFSLWVAAMGHTLSKLAKEALLKHYYRHGGPRS